MTSLVRLQRPLASAACTRPWVSTPRPWTITCWTWRLVRGSGTRPRRSGPRPTSARPTRPWASWRRPGPTTTSSSTSRPSSMTGRQRSRHSATLVRLMLINKSCTRQPSLISLNVTFLADQREANSFILQLASNIKSILERDKKEMDVTPISRYYIFIMLRGVKGLHHSNR